ncbi:hypothetical protein MKK63_20745 [Methylobacterium sp. J-088]|uniref:hypothetical protein n=1 Tax=Methylobacterium sp. J-088 TaxID=2836664 RepID=UPI001FBA7DFA|nr:hypothetical protein [Methylobacterium sp. J-088]MCJ2065121.1 hypothetical protein [Methylobacterium sp. J-088]
MSATRPARLQARTQSLVLGMLLPLALAGTAAAQQQGAASQGGWVDPPPRAAAPAAGATRESMNPAVPKNLETNVAKAQPETPRDAAPVRQAAKPEPGEDALPKAAATRAPGPKRAAALERPPVRESLRRREHYDARQEARQETYRPHRLAETPAAIGPAPGVSAERVAAARALTASYLATVSGSDDTMVGAATRYYASRVRFYGRPVTTAGLVAEKRSFVQRWPERRYEPRAMRTACDAETCTIRTLVEFRTANPGRGAVSIGEAELILEVGFAGARPYILGETGRVLRRSIQAGTLAASPGKA